MNLRWSWDEQTRDLFRWVDPEQWDATSTTPSACSASWRATGSTPRQRPRIHAVPRRGAHRARSATSTAPLVPGREATARCARRLLLARVRHRRGAARSTPAASACWPATTSRRRSDLGVPLVGVGLLYRHGYFRQSLDVDGWQQERYPALDPHAMALTPVRGRAGRGRPRRRAARRPGVAARRRPRAAVPPRRRHRGEPRRDPRRSPTGSTAATSSTGCGRRSCSASAACARCRPSATRPRSSTRTRATPASSASSASAGSSSTTGSPSPRRIEAVRAGLHLHDPHPGAGRHRPLPARADGEYFAGWADECRRRRRRPHGARPPPGRRRPTSRSTWR